MIIKYSETREKIKNAIGSDDLIIRDLNLGELSSGLFYFDALSDKQLIEQDIIRPLTNLNEFYPERDYLQRCVDYGEDVETAATLEEATQIIAEGDVVLVADGAREFFVISLRKYQHRAVQEPPTEIVIKGPREGFIEDIKVNLSMLRRKLKTLNLKIKNFKVGRYSNTAVSVAYIDGIADKDTVAEICQKVRHIDIDGIVGAAYIERYIEQNSNSLFNQSGITEKPDIVMAKILEGRVAVFIDGSPVVTTVPHLIFESFQDSYDYYIRDARATMLRALRICGAIFSVLLPAVYVAVQEYHYHLLPLKFLISVLNAIDGIPFTPPMEMLFVLILFEVLHQASVRMPRYVGTALSIVGAIVLGETAVNAGLLSSPAVLIVAISAIGINCVPDLVDAFSVLRFLLLLIGSVLGLFGIIIFSTMIIAYLSGIENYKTAYLSPFAPYIASDMKDAIIKDNLINMKLRPYSVKTKNRRRQGDE